MDAARPATDRCSASISSSVTGVREVGASSTAVTLYSGQLVAQSLYSVVTTFAPLPGKWNVV